MNASSVRTGRSRSGGEQVESRPRGPARSRRWLWWTVAIVSLFVIIVPSLLAGMITDWMWFDSQNLGSVYTTRLWLGISVFFAGFVVTTLFCWFNWSLAWRFTQPGTLYPGQRDLLPRSRVRGVIVAVAVIIGLFMGLVVAEEWPVILLYVNSVPFGQTDPLFRNDIGFYVFALPFYKLLRGWALILLVVTAIGAGLIYGISSARKVGNQVQRGARPTTFAFSLDASVRAHLSILGAIFLALIAIGYWLDRFDLLYSTRAFATGAGYTDVHAKWPALNIMMVVAVVMAVLLLVNIRVRTWKLLVGALGVWLVALLLVSGAYPAIVQEFVVKPSEYSLEEPYIRNNITATRQAFNLDKFTDRVVPSVGSVTPQLIAQNQSTVNNIRLWDYRPLRDTYSQLQEFRPYYSFNQVDIDRYNLGGVTRQVMLSARELSTDLLSDQTKTWQNIHFVYTHGYGAVVSPVNAIVGEGLPQLLVKDIPPQTDLPELKITRPEIYYGEQTDQYVFVGANTQEFDYPTNNGDAFTNYQGGGGVQMSNFFTRLLFSVRFGDGNIMLSDYITPQTRVLFHRNIQDAMNLLAPFLVYDYDPYLVISGGKLYWMQDAYTVTDNYPYSTPLENTDTLHNIPEGTNYIRNSVKVVFDAYTGAATFYVADPTDPIIKAYRAIFPSLFKDISEMPAGLRAHVRYPEDLMNAQAQMYATFHMTDPRVFYTKEDQWSVPLGTQSDTSAEPLESYYVNMALPGEQNEEFMMILPFTPATRGNMIAWMAAKSDEADYGKVEVISYSKQQLVYGPNQIGARVNQDPLISQQLSLWNQGGSKVIRGNLLTIPISNTVLYVEPLFLQATSGSSSFPELKRVIVATGTSVGIGSDLNDALNVAFNLTPGQIIGGTGGTGGTGQPGGNPTPGTQTAAGLTQSAIDHYNRAQEALKQGDWTTYGQEMAAMKSNLDSLAALEGVPTPAPPPGATPSP